MDDFLELKKIIGEENVSRETFSKLKLYVSLLEKWNKRINLISRRNIGEVWSRHIFDCAQIAKYINTDARTIIDLGSGAGLPGLITAILLPEIKMHLVESDQRKGAFLTEVKSSLSLDNTALHLQRIESLQDLESDVITSRALGTVSNIFDLSFDLIKKSKKCIFLKGQNVVEEIKKANICWDFDYRIDPSQTGDGYILTITHLQRRD